MARKINNYIQEMEEENVLKALLIVKEHILKRIASALTEELR